MAITKSGGSKKPFGGSYTSTATLVVFMFLSVFGVWMLTSNSIVSPHNNNLPEKQYIKQEDHQNGRNDRKKSINSNTTTDKHTKLDEQTSSKMLNESNAYTFGYKWELCNVTTGIDYIPCLDNEKAISKIHGRHHFEHRERHCPEHGSTCLVPLPDGYKTPIPWPESRNKVQVL